MPDTKSRVAVVGARANRQGTGRYIAGAFAENGCDVCAIVGTSAETVQAAKQALEDEYGMDCRTYTSLSTLCRQEKPDIVAISTPMETHYPLITTALHAGCHVFCEKPLWWQTGLPSRPAIEIREAVNRITNRCMDTGLLLKLNTQWPFTLPAFQQLHPDLSLEASDIKNFSMWMSPVSTGSQMIVDAAPHLLSMLYAFTGRGALTDIQCSSLEKNTTGDCTRLLLQCVHEHDNGHINVDFLLTHHPQQPRPAGYRINGYSAERFVELPQYLLSFADGDRRIPVKDPLKSAVEDFLNAIASSEPTDSESLLFGMMELHKLTLNSNSLEY